MEKWSWPHFLRISVMKQIQRKTMTIQCLYRKNTFMTFNAYFDISINQNGRMSQKIFHYSSLFKFLLVVMERDCIMIWKNMDCWRIFNLSHCIDSIILPLQKFAYRLLFLENEQKHFRAFQCWRNDEAILFYSQLTTILSFNKIKLNWMVKIHTTMVSVLCLCRKNASETFHKLFDMLTHQNT